MDIKKLSSIIDTKPKVVVTSSAEEFIAIKLFEENDCNYVFVENEDGDVHRFKDFQLELKIEDLEKSKKEPILNKKEDLTIDR